MAKLSGKLSVLMPAYNEETIIYANALEAARQISPLADDYELLVIDDGSSDRTKAEIERAAAENPKIRCISYQPNQGKGGALREGTAHATGDYIAFCDADLDLAPEQLADFIDRMQRENADVVIGSKMHPESKVDYPAIRRVYSWGYYILLLILFRLNVRDTAVASVCAAVVLARPGTDSMRIWPPATSVVIRDSRRFSWPTRVWSRPWPRRGPSWCWPTSWPT
mgnify:CR=1 FL=1